MNTAETEKLFRDLNALGLLAITCILTYAEYGQLVLQEMPCPLCLLQRMGFVAVMFGLLLNVLYGSRSLHYSICTLGALFGGIAALRQISLHVAPGDTGYGPPVMGFHYYTWAFIVFMVIIFGLAGVRAFGIQYKGKDYCAFGEQSLLCRIAIVLALVIVLVNAVVTFAECGPLECPSDPKSYWLFSR